MHLVSSSSTVFGQVLPHGRSGNRLKSDRVLSPKTIKRKQILKGAAAAVALLSIFQLSQK